MRPARGVNLNKYPNSHDDVLNSGRKIFNSLNWYQKIQKLVYLQSYSGQAECAKQHQMLPR